MGDVLRLLQEFSYICMTRRCWSVVKIIKSKKKGVTPFGKMLEEEGILGEEVVFVGGADEFDKFLDDELEKAKREREHEKGHRKV